MAAMDEHEVHNKSKKAKQNTYIALILLALVVIVAISYFAMKPAPESTVSQERLELDPYMGNADAPVTIVEYAAFGCDSCRRWHQAGIVEQLLTEFPNQVKFIYRDLPIIMPEWSQEMAEVAQCALDQGQDAFWLLHDALYIDADFGRSTQSEIVQMGADLGLDEEVLQACVEADTHYQTVRYDMQRSEVEGLRGTPIWFVNGQLVYDASSDQLRELIEIELSSLSS